MRGSKREQEERKEGRRGEEKRSADKLQRGQDSVAAAAASRSRYELSCLSILKSTFFSSPVFQFKLGTYRRQLLAPGRSASLVGGGHVGQILNDLLGVFCFASSGLAPGSDTQVEKLAVNAMYTYSIADRPILHLFK